MICKKCGKEAEFDSAFCYYCGSEFKEEQPEKPVSNKKSLGFGIASLACGVYGLCLLSVPYISLILGIVGSVLGKKVLNSRWHKFAKAGRITSIVSIALGAVVSVIYTLFIIMCITGIVYSLL